MDLETLLAQQYDAVLHSLGVSAQRVDMSALTAIHHNLRRTLEESGLFPPAAAVPPTEIPA